jgi:hypothetical protein
MPPEQRQRIQMVLLRESGPTQPAIGQAMGVSLSTVNRAHMAYDHGGIKAYEHRISGMDGRGAAVQYDGELVFGAVAILMGAELVAGRKCCWAD